MRVNEVRKLNDAELGKELQRRQVEMAQLRFDATARLLTDHTKIKKVRRIIARIETVIQERRIIRSES